VQSAGNYSIMNAITKHIKYSVDTSSLIKAMIQMLINIEKSMTDMEITSSLRDKILDSLIFQIESIARKLNLEIIYTGNDILYFDDGNLLAVPVFDDKRLLLLDLKSPLNRILFDIHDKKLKDIRSIKKSIKGVSMIYSLTMQLFKNGGDQLDMQWELDDAYQIIEKSGGALCPRLEKVSSLEEAKTVFHDFNVEHGYNILDDDLKRVIEENNAK